MTFDLRFRHPFSMLVSGPTGSGKTSLVFNLIADFKNTMTIKKNVIKVIYCYAVWQPMYDTWLPDVDIHYHKGFCYDYLDMDPDLIVVDDLMIELAKDSSLTSAFTKHSHHNNISIIFLTQNLFFQSKELRTVSLNCHYIILLKNPRDKLQILTLGRQVFPGKNKMFGLVYDEAVKEAYSHLIIDMTSACPDELRLRQRRKIGGAAGFLIFEMRE